MIAVLIVLGLQGVPVQPQGHSVKGYAAYYAPDVMRRVFERRFPDETYDPAGCYVAVPTLRVRDIVSNARYVSVRSRVNEETIVCRITDVAREEDKGSINARGIVVELDFESAVLLCLPHSPGQRIPRDSQTLNISPRECPIDVRYIDP